MRSVNNVDAVCSIVYEQENICTPNKKLDFVPVEYMGAPNKTLDFVPVEYIGAPIKTLDFVTVEYIYATLGAFLGYICSTYSSIKKLDFVSDCNVTDVEACPHLDYCTDSVQPCSIYYESEICDVRHRSHVVSRNIPDVEACPHLNYCTDSVPPCSMYYESEICDVRPCSNVVLCDVPEPNAVLEGNIGPLCCEYSEDDEDYKEDDDEDYTDDDEDYKDDDEDYKEDDDEAYKDDDEDYKYDNSRAKYDGTPEFGNFGCLGDLHTHKVDLVSNNPKSPTNPSLGRTRSDNKPPDKLSESMHDITTTKPDLCAQTDPFVESMGRHRSDSKLPDNVLSENMDVLLFNSNRVASHIHEVHGIMCKSRLCEWTPIYVILYRCWSWVISLQLLHKYREVIILLSIQSSIPSRVFLYVWVGSQKGKYPNVVNLIVIRLSLNMVIPVHHFQLIHDGHLIMVVIVIILSLCMVMPLHLLFGIMGVAPSSLLNKVNLYEWVTS